MLKTQQDVYPIGTLPPLGDVPPKMYAQVIRAERYGDVAEAFQTEIVDTPQIGPKQMLVAVMAAGLNFNNVWAAKGYPVDVIAWRNKRGQMEDFHIGGSDGAGIVYKVGEEVTDFEVGDEVVVAAGYWDADDPFIKAGNDPVASNTFRAWGYETNWGSFAQFSVVNEQQCHPKPKHLDWAEAASYMLCGMTAYRMLHHWTPNTLREGDPVLIWGGTGGLGVFGIQLARLAGAVPVAVVGSDARKQACLDLGAEGVINRKDFDHWGVLPPEINDQIEFEKWIRTVIPFGQAIWKITGKGNNPRIVLEHPGESTMPTSIFVTDKSGMVVICGGTTGYRATLDLRLLWMHQKRLQGSHASDWVEARAFNDLVAERRISVGLSHVYPFEDVGRCHQLLEHNLHPAGNMVVLVGATGQIEPGPRDYTAGKN